MGKRPHSLLRHFTNPAPAGIDQGRGDPAVDRLLPLPNPAAPWRLGRPGHPLYAWFGLYRYHQHPAGNTLFVPGNFQGPIKPPPGRDFTDSLYHRSGGLRLRHLPHRRLGSASLRLWNYGRPLSSINMAVYLAANIESET